MLTRRSAGVAEALKTRWRTTRSPASLRLAKIALRGTPYDSLPIELLRVELADVLKSPSYVSEALSRRQPPAHAILRTLLDEPSLSVPLHGFRQRIDDETAVLCERVNNGTMLIRKKQYDLYRRVLCEAWKSGMTIDASETALLAVLRRELQINHQEHVLVQYHNDVTPFWRNERAFDRERAGLSVNGLLFVHESASVIPEELAPAIREALEMPLRRDALKRLYGSLQNTELGGVLQELGLRQNGSKDERVETLVANPVSPDEVLSQLNLVESLRPLAKRLYCAQSGTKDELIDTLITHMARDGDIQGAARANEQQAPPPPRVVEPKSLSEASFRSLFVQLTGEELYEILSAFAGLRRSGTKEARIDTLLASPFSENTLLEALTNRSLANVLDRLRLRVSGLKDEKIERLIDYARSVRAIEALPADLAASEAAAEPVGAAPPPQHARAPQIDAVQRDLAFLDRDQATVIAVLKQMQSLSDLELDQLAASHQMSWIFAREEMRRLIQLLADKGVPLIERRETGEHDIYVYRGQTR